MKYRRDVSPGATWFFTLALHDRRSELLLRHVDDFRDVFAAVKTRHPFANVAMVILPDHLHAILRLPEGDSNYAKRWSLIKSGFSRRVPNNESVNASRFDKRERGVWQRRYWEHRIRDDTDLQRHIDYIHYNPVKHGYVKHAIDWPHSTLHAYIEQGRLPENWGAEIVARIDFPVGE